MTNSIKLINYLKSIQQRVADKESSRKCMEIWEDENKRPVLDMNCFHSIVNQSMYNFNANFAQDYFNGKEWEIYTEAYKWNIEQSIINRDAGLTMTAAAFDYVNDIIDNEREKIEMAIEFKNKQ
jgi:hypothetical protein